MKTIVNASGTKLHLSDEKAEKLVRTKEWDYSLNNESVRFKGCIDNQCNCNNNNRENKET
ncbi:hypothetical protein H8D85_00515 [bacterium]|nr:hypothetical protein [bacterium]